MDFERDVLKKKLRKKKKNITVKKNDILESYGEYLFLQDYCICHINSVFCREHFVTIKPIYDKENG